MHLSVEFQDFIPRFNKIPQFMNTLTEGFEGVKGGQRRGDFMNNLSIYIYTPRDIYKGCAGVFDKYLHWSHVSVKNLDV
jgi:hypothetical protein